MTSTGSFSGGDIGLRVGDAASVGNALLKCHPWIECLAGNLTSVDIASGDGVAACGNLTLAEEPSGNESFDWKISAKLLLADWFDGLLHGLCGRLEPFIEGNACDVA
jgi:hypothetical protein